MGEATVAELKKQITDAQRLAETHKSTASSLASALAAGALPQSQMVSSSVESDGEDDEEDDRPDLEAGVEPARESKLSGVDSERIAAVSSTSSGASMNAFDA